jgi:hypothetical protein
MAGATLGSAIEYRRFADSHQAAPSMFVTAVMDAARASRRVLDTIPSPNRTCRFPAPGSPEKLFHQTFTDMPFRFTAAQRDRALFLEPLKDGPIFREPEPALTASLEILDQAA